MNAKHNLYIISKFNTVEDFVKATLNIKQSAMLYQFLQQLLTEKTQDD